MPIVRNENLPQHNLGTMHYGELPIEGLPSGTAAGQTFVWIHSTQEWKKGVLVGVSGLAVNVDPDTGNIEISLSDRIVSDVCTADSIVKATYSGTLLADAVLV